METALPGELSNRIDNKRETVTFYTLFLIIFSTSFFLYSPSTSIRLSSDHAVHILMAQNFRFPEDLYYWGQNRLGSLVPMLAHIICVTFGASAIFSVTLVHWGLLFFTSLMICRFFSRVYIKILFLIFWLLPMPPFKEHLALAHPYAPQFFLIFSGILLISKFRADQSDKKYLWLATGILALLLSCWVSELSATFLILFFAFSFIWEIRHSSHKSNVLFKKQMIPITLISFSVIAAVGYFISYAKFHATPVTEYSTILSEPKDWAAGIMQHLKDAGVILSRTTEEGHLLFFIPRTICILLMFPLIFFTLRSFLRNRKTIPKDKLFYICLFSISCILIWFGLYMLGWTHLNQYDYRHWTFAYPFAILMFLLIADAEPGKLSWNKITLGVLALAQIVLSSTYAIDKYGRNEIDFSYSEIKEFRQLGKCGLIGSYGFTYVIATADPSVIVATPREGEYARASHLIPLVFLQPKLYLAKNMWLDKWPSFIRQYGHQLQKNGIPFKIGRVELCEYVIKENDFSLASDLLGHDPRSTDGPDGIRVNPEHHAMDGFAVVGPFLDLRPGTYKGSFYIDSIASFNGDTVTLDIVSNWGALVPFRKVFTGANIKDSLPPVLPFEFTLSQPAPNIETRIYVKGKSSLSLKRVDLTKK